VNDDAKGCLSLIVGFALALVLAIVLLVLAEVASYVCPLVLVDDPDSTCVLWPLS
jgi:hypothetical protein